MLQSEGPVNWEIAAADRRLRRARRRDERADRSSRRATATSSRSWPGPRRATSSRRPGSTATLGLRTRSAIGRKEWVDLHLDALRPVLEALAVTLAQGARRRRRAGPAAADPAGRTRPDGHRSARRSGPAARPVRRAADDARPAAARRAGGLDGRVPRAARARSLRPPAPDRRRARASRSSCRTSTRSRRRGRSTARDLRFAVALHEVVHAAERSVPWVREQLARLWRSSTCPPTRSTRTRSRASSASSTRPTRRRSPGSPSTPRRCSARCSPTRQHEILERVQGLTMVLEGYADVVVERLGSKLLPDVRPHPRGDAAPSRRAGRGRALHRAAARPAARPGALREGRVVLPRRHRAGRASTASTGSGSPSRCSRPPASSTPPASGSPASTSRTDLIAERPESLRIKREATAPTASVDRR